MIYVGTENASIDVNLAATYGEGFTSMLWVNLSATGALYLLACEIIERAVVRADGGEIYRAKFGWRVFWWVCMGGSGIAIAERLLGHGGGPKETPLWLLILAFLSLVISWPRTVTVNSVGLSSVSLFGLRRRFIPWSEVAAITSDWEEESLFWKLQAIWKFTGTRILVLSRAGTRIGHTIFLRKQARFLDDLRRYAPKQVFAPGIYDWNPAA